MLNRIRQHLGLGRRSRRSVIAVAWLCFLLAAMPCMTAWAACCPSPPVGGEGQASVEASAHGHHDVVQHADHHVEPSPQDEAAHEHAGHDCDSNGGSCCDEALPTLEDRSPKPLPSALAAGLVAATDFSADSPFLDRTRQDHGTGPPDRLRPQPRTHLEHCRFLI